MNNLTARHYTPATPVESHVVCAKSNSTPYTPEVHDLLDAIVTIRVLRRQHTGFAWDKLYNVGEYLEKQVRAYFAPEAA